ncbi:alpha/beta hydrolase [Promicromonospora soli]|uniref:Alpha/beta hydrolase fold-3 domain-containing protein n=1 Tax=Promicromonospora soli TaxID=2035533 RepID=A0A919G4G0_9MICO|nr:hypothetical protein GCM10017772_38110 [Promicromonospora soli]
MIAAGTSGSLRQGLGDRDAFRDEDTTYAIKLSRAGVPVEFHPHPGMPHEFDSIAFRGRRSRASRHRQNPSTEVDPTQDRARSS